MVLFFFYNKLTNKELIDKISINNKIIDGTIMVQEYNIINNDILINNINKNNNKILLGKIVEFDISFNDVINKINSISEYKSNIIEKKYIIETVKAFDKDNKVYLTYIIY